MRILLAIVLSVASLSAADDYSPGDRGTDWSLTGVPNLDAVRAARVVFTNMAGLDTTGNLDCQPAIQAALNACPSNGVVVLPAGRLVISNALTVHLNQTSDGGWITLMGAGRESTTLIRKGSGTTVFATGIEGLRGTSNSLVYSSLVKGASNILAWSVDTDFLRVGDILILTRQDENPTNFNIVFGNAYLTNDNIVDLVGLGNWFNTGSGDVFKQYVLCTSVNGTNIGIWPPLYYSWTNEPGLYAHCKSIYGTANFIGLESLTVTNVSNVVADGSHRLYFSSAYGCWIKDVRIYGAEDSLILFTESVFNEIRDSDILNVNTNSEALGVGDITGILLSGANAMKIENNSFSGHWSQMMLNNSSSGNAITYNYFTNGLHWQSIPDTTQPDIFINHLGHCMMNLTEGNIMAGFHADNYHGSSSYNTVFRNNIHGMNHAFGFGLTNHIRCIDLCRFSYYYNIVGNILGSPEAMRSGSLYQAETNATLDSSIPLIYRLGYPNTGNDCHNCSGVFITYEGQSGTAVNGFPVNWDPRVTNTLVRLNNYDFKTPGIADSTTNLPSSLIYSSAPSWFSGYTWPPANPTTPAWAVIPAQARFYGASVVGTSAKTGQGRTKGKGPRGRFFQP